MKWRRKPKPPPPDPLPECPNDTHANQLDEAVELARLQAEALRRDDTLDL